MHRPILSSALALSPLAFSSASTAQVPSQAAGVVTLDIEVRTKSESLYRGSLNVGPQVQATYSREITEASPTNCTRSTDPDEDDRQRPARQSTSFRLTAAYSERQGEPKPFSLTVRWSQPTASSCPTEAGTRTIEFSQAFTLAPGAKTSFDSFGLTISVRRPD